MVEKPEENKQPTPKKLWFRRKFYGWGWVPITWQGWIVFALYVLLIVILLENAHVYHGFKPIVSNVIIPIIILTWFLVYICLKKGEKPRWHWNKKTEKEETLK